MCVRSRDDRLNLHRHGKVRLLNVCAQISQLGHRIAHTQQTAMTVTVAVALSMAVCVHRHAGERSDVVGHLLLQLGDCFAVLLRMGLQTLNTAQQHANIYFNTYRKKLRTAVHKHTTIYTDNNCEKQ
jgi:hypothetical protein